MKWKTSGLKVRKGMDGNVISIPAPSMDDINDIDIEKEYAIEIKLPRRRRSLDANAYAWVLCQKIADKLSKDGSYHSKEDVYRKCIKECGHFTILPVRNDAIKRWREIWQGHGIGWLTERLGPCKRTKGYTNMIAYHGSSIYTVEEMRRFISCLLDDAAQLDISTDTDVYIDGLIDQWGDGNGDKETV